MRWASAFLGTAATTALMTWAACQGGPNYGNDSDNDGTTSGDTDNGSSSSGSFVTDGAAICGADVHQPITHPPSIYFVIDRSGSMLDIDPESGDTRYERVTAAAVSMVEDIGGLVRTGAALFPSPEASDLEECESGIEVFKPKVGAGPNSFADAIDVEPLGGTPIAATLRDLADRINDLDGPRAVILLTDGGPNCNPNASCGPEECMVNIFGECPPEIDNCCDPNVGGTPLNCIDRQESVLAVRALANADSPVYVVGIPGSEQFSAILNQLAVVGGAAQEGQDDYYFRVDDLDELSGVFKDIASALVSCTIDLADPPEVPGKTNVYFDEVVVLQDPENGWIWIDEDTIELKGSACTELKSGSVSEVLIVSGCPTETPL